MLNGDFFKKDDVVGVAQDLLGGILITNFQDRLTAGIITETEAYHQSEKACHAFNARRTKRTEWLFHGGGRAYVYLCYGIHHLFNITTGREGDAAAVLIRAIEPVRGLETMLERRKQEKIQPKLTSGPGMLTQALGISVNHTGVLLEKTSGIWIEEGTIAKSKKKVIASTRIGVDYAEEDALLPWRFYLGDSKWVSKF